MSVTGLSKADGLSSWTIQTLYCVMGVSTLSNYTLQVSTGYTAVDPIPQFRYSSIRLLLIDSQSSWRRWRQPSLANHLASFSFSALHALFRCVFDWVGVLTCLALVQCKGSLIYFSHSRVECLRKSSAESKTLSALLSLAEVWSTESSSCLTLSGCVWIDEVLYGNSSWVSCGVVDTPLTIIADWFARLAIGSINPLCNLLIEANRQTVWATKITWSFLAKDITFSKAYKIM